MVRNGTKAIPEPHLRDVYGELSIWRQFAEYSTRGTMHVDKSDPTAADHITIALADEPRGALRPLSVDLHVGALHAVFSARQAKTIDEIFQPDFARTVRDICLAVAPDAQIVNAPDFSVRIHGLRVEGYTLVCQTLEDGFRRFTIRLRRATGNPLAVLRLGASDAEAPSAATGEVLREIDGRVGADRLFDGMLAHLYLPLVNLNSYLRTVLDGQRDCPGEQYSISAVQLRARTEILQYAFDRMIAELMVARAADGDEAAGEPLCAESQRIAGAAPPEARFA
jgi:hypothetical protein